jgi:hypothetical protein
MAEEFTADELTRSYAQAVELDARAGEVLERTSQEAATANPCEVWHDIRPMVEDISNLWFIPRKIRALIKLVIAIVDSLCK